MSTPMRFKANVSAGMGESSLASSSSNPEERRPRLRPPHPANNSMKVCMTVQYREVSEKSPGTGFFEDLRLTTCSKENALLSLSGIHEQVSP